MALADELLARFPDYAISHLCHMSNAADVAYERDGWPAAGPLFAQLGELLGPVAITFDAARALARVRAGLADEAEAYALAALDYLAAGDGGSNRALAAAGVAEAAALLGRPDWAAAVVDELTPHLGAMISYSFGWRVFPASLAVGFAASALGRHDEAIAHLDDAVAMAERFRAPALVVRCRLALVRGLHARASQTHGDLERTTAELAAATEAADRLGLTERLAECRELDCTLSGQPD